MKLPDWLERYMVWAGATGNQTPLIFHQAGLWLLATAVERRLYGEAPWGVRIYPILSAEDKATIRTVFLRFCDENLNAYTTNNNHPEPIGVVNAPVLVSNPSLVRWAATTITRRTCATWA